MAISPDKKSGLFCKWLDLSGTIQIDMVDDNLVSLSRTQSEFVIDSISSFY